MTWWEVEQMARDIADLEKAMDDWALSGVQMRMEQQKVDHLESKIQHVMDQADDERKKEYLRQLTDRVENLRRHLTERLKRDVTSRSRSG